MKVTLTLATFEVDHETETKSLIDIKEQDVYMGDMPAHDRKTAPSSSTAPSA